MARVLGKAVFFAYKVFQNVHMSSRNCEKAYNVIGCNLRQTNWVATVLVGHIKLCHAVILRLF